MAKDTGSAARQPRGKTVSVDNLEAIFTKKALEHYIDKIEAQVDWSKDSIFSRDEVVEKLECVVDKLSALPYFTAAAAPRKPNTATKTTATRNTGSSASL